MPNRQNAPNAFTPDVVLDAPSTADVGHAARPLKNWFDQGGKAYARFRPEYPPELAQFLASVAPGAKGGAALALDVGCGNGQLTTQLAAHFAQVLGADPSADQVASAVAHPRVEYVCAVAEALPVASGCIQLITAAQAAHWFDLPRFYQEARRIAAPQAALALVSYGVLQLDDEALNARFGHFYTREIGPYWPAERKRVDSGYADLPFPFEEMAAPPLAIAKKWSLDALLGYISTWSAVRRAYEAGCAGIVQNFAADMTALWGDPMHERPVRWPINMRLGML